jgi:DUF4097 and DUF4098 domain-containing protein YvlB
VAAAGVKDSYSGTINPNSSLEISTDIPNIGLYKGSKSNLIEVKLEGVSDNRFKLEVEKTHEGYTIEVKKRRTFNLGIGNFLVPELRIYIPEGLALNDLEISSVSGKISSELPLKAQNIEIASVSGSIEIPHLAGSRRVEIATVSGKVEIAVTISPRTSIGSVSGALNLSSIQTDQGSVEVESVSGSISIGHVEASHGSFESVSGKVVAALPSTYAGTVETSTLSGNVQVDFPHIQSVSHNKNTTAYRLGASEETFRFSSTSGKLHITQ